MRALLLTAIAIIFLFTLTAQVEGADWEKINEDNKAIYYLDLSSIKKFPDNHYKAWQKIIIKDPSLEFIRLLSYSEFDCDSNKKRILQKTGYKKNGESFTGTRIESWNYIVPDTTGELTLTFICSNYRGNWEKFHENDESILYIDRNSIKKLPNNHYMVWEKDERKDPSDKEEYVIYYFEFDCVNKRTRVQEMISYHTDNTVHAMLEPLSIDFNPISFNEVCHKKGGDKK